MKHKKTELICEVETLRKEVDRARYYRQMLEGKIHNRNDKIVELQKENKDLKDSIRFKDDYIEYLNRVITKDVEKMAKYVSFYEKVLELFENLEGDSNEIEDNNQNCTRFGTLEDIPNCSFYHVNLSKEDLEDISIGDIIERILKMVGEEDE